MNKPKNEKPKADTGDVAGFAFVVGVLALLGLLAGAYGIDQLHDWFGDKNWTGPFTWDEP